MNRVELRNKLDLLGIDSRTHSLHGDLIPDSIVLYDSYNDWEVFYLDERGHRNEQKTFASETEACTHIYELFKRSKEIEDKYL